MTTQHLSVNKSFLMSKDMEEKIKQLATEENRSEGFIIRMLITLGLEVAPH